MRRALFILTLIFPVSVWANSDAPSPLDTWDLVDNSLKFNVAAILSARQQGGEPIPATPWVTLELYRGNFYKLSIITRAAEGYAFPHFLTGEPVEYQPPSTRATAAFGYYTIQSDTLRFNAHYLRLIADGEDLEDIVRESSDARSLNEYNIVISLVNGLFLGFFNDLYAYRSGNHLVFVLPRNSAFAGGAPDAVDGIVWKLRRSGGTPSTSTTVVQATVVGNRVGGLAVEFARSISGIAAHYAWRGITDENGRVDLDISTLDRSGVTGYYSARVLDGTGRILGQWYSIPLNEDRRQVLELKLGGSARVVESHVLNAAKIVALGSEQPEAGLAPNFPNPFNSSTLIVYRLADPGPVRLEIFNSLGQHLRTLVADTQAAGRYVVQWNARDRHGDDVAAGVYLMRLLHPGGVDARRMLYLK